MKSNEIINAHNYFSKYCFNEVWKLIDKQDRSISDNQKMIALSFSSLWHWQERKDHTNEHLSTAYWQISRVYSLIGEGLNAIKYAKFCLDISKNKAVKSFYLGYAYEALARAEMVNNNTKNVNKYLNLARDIGNDLLDKEEREFLLEDLKSIKF